MPRNRGPEGRLYGLVVGPKAAPVRPGRAINYWYPGLSFRGRSGSRRLVPGPRTPANVLVGHLPRPWAFASNRFDLENSTISPPTSIKVMATPGTSDPLVVDPGPVDHILHTNDDPPPPPPPRRVDEEPGPVTSLGRT